MEEMRWRKDDGRKGAGKERAETRGRKGEGRKERAEMRGRRGLKG